MSPWTRVTCFASWAEDELEPAPVGAEVEADDGVTVLEDAVETPRAEATE